MAAHARCLPITGPRVGRPRDRKFFILPLEGRLITCQSSGSDDGPWDPGDCPFPVRTDNADAAHPGGRLGGDKVSVGHVGYDLIYIYCICHIGTDLCTALWP